MALYLVKNGTQPKNMSARRHSIFHSKPLEVFLSEIVGVGGLVRICLLLGIASLGVLGVSAIGTFCPGDVVVSLVVPGSGGRSERSRVGPDVILGLVGGSSSFELGLNVPEVHAVSPEDLENESSNSGNQGGQEDSGRMVNGSLSEGTVLSVIEVNQ